MPILLFKVTLAVVLTSACCWLLLDKRIQNRLQSCSWNLLSAIFTSTRLLIWFVLYVVLRLGPQSDLTVYLDQARSTLRGLRPFADFDTAYGPFNAYFMAAFIWLWDDGAMLVLLAVLFEIGAWFIWNRVLRELLPDRQAKLAATLYMLAPLAVLNSPMVGLNHIWLSAFLALGVWYSIRIQPFASGFALGLSIVLVKFLSLLFVPILGWVSRDKVRWSCGLLVPVAAGYGWLLADGRDPFSQVTMHAHYNSSGNLPYLLGITGINPAQPAVRTFFNLTGMVVLGGGFIAALLTGRLRTQWQAFLGLPLVMVVTMIVSKKSFSSYLEIVQLPLVVVFLLLATRRRWTAAVFAVFMITTSLEPSLWFRWLTYRELIEAKSLVPAWQLSIFLVVEVLMLLSYAFLCWSIWRLLREDRYRESV